jgi:small subunit ribosomal protein S6
LIKQFRGAIEKENGVVIKVEKWGKRKLAYSVKKHSEGIFVLIIVQGTLAPVVELERRFKMTESVLKFLTVRIDPQLKRQGKWPLEVEPEIVEEKKIEVPAAEALQAVAVPAESVPEVGEGTAGFSEEPAREHEARESETESADAAAGPETAPDVGTEGSESFEPNSRKTVKEGGQP